MDRKQLKWLRLVMPGIIAMALLLPVKEQLSVFYDGKLPFEIGILEVPLFAFVVGVAYQVIGIRPYFNFKFHQQVRRNIRERLWNAARSSPVPADWDDKKSRDTFYNLVDNDNSLTARTDMVYFNGAIWTSVADVRALGFIFSAVAIGMLLDDTSNANALVLLALNVAAVLASFPISYLVTQHHIRLGDEQLDYISAHLRTELDQRISNYGL